MRLVPSAGIGFPIERFDAHLLHQRADVFAFDHDFFSRSMSRSMRAPEKDDQDATCRPTGGSCSLSTIYLRSHRPRWRKTAYRVLQQLRLPLRDLVRMNIKSFR